MARSTKDTVRALLRAWSDVEARVVAEQRVDVAHVAGGVGRYATCRVFCGGKVKPDAAGALRA
eukprot:11023699-Lingulodinium_polyedra.AAC.1